MLKLEHLKAREGEFLLFKTKEIFGVDFFMMRRDKKHSWSSMWYGTLDLFRAAVRSSSSELQKNLLVSYAVPVSYERHFLHAARISNDKSVILENSMINTFKIRVVLRAPSSFLTSWLEVIRWFRVLLRSSLTEST